MIVSKDRLYKILKLSFVQFHKTSSNQTSWSTIHNLGKIYFRFRINTTYIRLNDNLSLYQVEVNKFLRYRLLMLSFCHLRRILSMKTSSSIDYSLFQKFLKQITHENNLHPSTSHLMLSYNESEQGPSKQVRVLSFELTPQVFEHKDQFVHSS